MSKNYDSKEKFVEKFETKVKKEKRKDRPINKNADMTIYPLREKDYIDEDRYKSLPEVLPKPNFRLLLNCYSGFGKDVIISNLLLRKDMFDITNKEKPFIDYFILVSPTARNDPSQIEMLKWADEYYENFTPQIFNDIKELQDSKRDEYDSDSEDEEEPFQILLYINDLIGDKTLGRELDLFLPKMRHSNVNLILSLQALKTKTTSPIVRSNMTHLICSKVMSEKQLASLDEEYTGSFGGKFRELYNYATAGRYDFLFLDLKKRIAHKCFTQKIFEGDENDNGNNTDIINDENDECK